MLRVFSTLHPPQKPLLFSGAGAAHKLADLLMASGQRRPLVVTGSFLSRKGLLDDLLSHMNSGGCDVAVFDGVIPNPSFEVVQRGLDLGRAHNSDCVIAIGGGSAIDTAKVIAAASTDGRALEKLVGVLKVKTPPLPFYAVPTTSGTGSEVTTSAVISDPKTHKKRFFVDPKYVPVAAALDTNLLVSLPAHITAATGMDALTHALEAYTSRNSFPDSDRDARLSVKLLFDFLPVACADGDNRQAREMVALGAFLAGYAFAKSSLGYVHAISHQLSAHYDTPHGLANAIILPRVLRFNRRSSFARYAELERMLSGEDLANPSEQFERFLDRVDRLSDEIRIPVDLPDLREDHFDEITRHALAEARSSYAVPQKMTRADVRSILTSVRSGERDPGFGGRRAA